MEFKLRIDPSSFISFQGFIKHYMPLDAMHYNGLHKRITAYNKRLYNGCESYHVTGFKTWSSSSFLNSDFDAFPKVKD